MKKIIFLFLTVCFTISAFAQTEPANYGSVVTKFKLYYNNNQPDSIYKLFGPEMKNALNPAQCKDMVSQLKSTLGVLQQTTFTTYDEKTPVAIYAAVFQNSPITMTIQLNKEDKISGLYFRPVKQEAAPSDPSLTESPIKLKTLAGTIRGTLTMPKNASGKIPVVIIIPGSGYVDRNGNEPGLKTNTYKLLAEGLGKSGIASLRYDKRMVGESETGNKESDLRFEDYVDDAVGLVGMLNDDQRFSKVIILGHSEGSLVGMLASRDQPVKAFISVSGAGDPADKILTEQMKSKPQYIADGFKIVLDSLKKGKIDENIDPALYPIARPSIQRYLMSWCRYNPAKELKGVKVPILLIQGTTDLQVPVAEAEKLKKAKSDAILTIIPGMNHVLKEAPADPEKNHATYNNPDLPLKAELVPDIVAFINKLN